MPRATNLIGFGSRRRLARMVPQSFAQMNGSLTTFTFAGVNLGDPASDRVLVVPVTAYDTVGTYAISSCSIGGVGGSVLVQEFTRLNGVAIIAAAVPSGATGDVVITFDEAIAYHCTILPIACYGVQAVAQDTAQQQSTSATVLSDTLSVPAGSLAFAVAHHGNSGSGLAWAGVDEEVDDRVVTQVSSRQVGAAGRRFLDRKDAMAVSATYGGTASVFSAAWASLKLAA